MTDEAKVISGTVTRMVTVHVGCVDLLLRRAGAAMQYVASVELGCIANARGSAVPISGVMHPW